MELGKAVNLGEPLKKVQPIIDEKITLISFEKYKALERENTNLKHEIALLQKRIAELEGN